MGAGLNCIARRILFWMAGNEKAPEKRFLNPMSCSVGSPPRIPLPSCDATQRAPWRRPPAARRAPSRRRARRRKPCLRQLACRHGRWPAARSNRAAPARSHCMGRWHRPSRQPPLHVARGFLPPSTRSDWRPRADRVRRRCRARASIHSLRNGRARTERQGWIHGKIDLIHSINSFYIE